MRNFTRPTLLAWLFFIGAFATTVGLGSWQVARLQWKEALIAEMEQARKQPPLTDLPASAGALADDNYRPVKLHGAWRPDIEYHLAPRYYKSHLGYHIMAPLQLGDGRVIFVNRGWVPSDKKEIATRPETIATGEANVAGMLRVGSGRTVFTPENQPQKNIWFGRDVEEMAAFHGVENVIPATVDAVGPQDIDRLPVPSDGAIHLRNDHLSYIITWYSIALAVLVIFILAHRRKN